MERLTDDALATHLEVALALAPPGTLDALQHPELYRRRRATAELARHLAQRLGCYDLRYEAGGDEEPLLLS